MTPVPEPASDIYAQLAAVMDPAHPKLACFLVPEDAHQVPFVLNAYIEAREEGVLVTTDLGLADRFSGYSGGGDGFDRMMAEILGYPEAKPDVVARCYGNPVVNAHAVQACDVDGNVITEAFASPDGLDAAAVAMMRHVPEGGRLEVITPTMSIARRVLLRGAKDA